MKKKTLKKIMFLAGLGILVSIYLLNLHYSSSESEICNINPVFSCTDVKNSSYSEAFGIPMAGYGLIGYLIIGVIVLFRYNKKKWLGNGKVKRLFTPQNLFYVSFLGLIISLYLTYLEIFVINALCLFCLISFGIIALITYYTYDNIKIRKK
tara:strand:- start:213 stop:668 length:456 start_codon:yes stop_codon:yes gene_type:complete